MSLLPFLFVCTLGALVTVFVDRFPRVSTAVGVGTVVVALLTALWISPGQPLLIGESGIATTDYLRVFLVLGAITGLLLIVVGAATDGHRHAPPVTLGILATSALALSIPDARHAILAATAGGAIGAFLATGPGAHRAGATAGIRTLRATAVAGTMAVSAMAWIGRDLSDLAAQPIVFGLAYLAVAVAVAVRFGAIPVHTWAARLTDAVPEATLPLVTAWGAAAFAVVALAWADAMVAPLLIDLESARLAVVAIGVVSILLASLAAWIQDDIEHIVGYSIVGDAGVVLLGVAALDPEAWAPARTWIIAFAVTRSAFAAWAAATRATFGTGRVDDLRGWAIRSPLLTVAFAGVVLAGIGIPGLAAFDARSRLVELSIGGPLGTVVLLGTLTPLAYYGRLLAVGVARPGPSRADGPAWRPTMTAVDLTDLPGWLVRTWSTNRIPVATATAVLLAALAVTVGAGGFGGPEAAAGLPPSLDVARESFEPGASPEPEPSFPPEESLPPEESSGTGGSASPQAEPEESASPGNS